MFSIFVSVLFYLKIQCDCVGIVFKITIEYLKKKSLKRYIYFCTHYTITFNSNKKYKIVTKEITYLIEMQTELLNCIRSNKSIEFCIEHTIELYNINHTFEF